jgi:hypothetical protein
MLFRTVVRDTTWHVSFYFYDHCIVHSGRKIVDPDPRPEMTLLTYLRNVLGLCGTKLGCGEGGCGACTVMISYYSEAEDDKKKNIVHLSVNACLTPVVAAHGMAVTTVEGIGSTKYEIARKSNIEHGHFLQEMSILTKYSLDTYNICNHEYSAHPRDSQT